MAPATPPNTGSNPAQPTFVSRGGFKLRHALTEFKIDPAGLIAADLGCSTGGFTDCLLQAGAAKVYAVDTAYGELAWKLRNDPRVVVTERTNALHAAPAPGGVDLVVVDLGWTPHRLLIPVALGWLKPGGRIITLIKPHYEVKDENPKALPRGGVLDHESAHEACLRAVARIESLGARVIGLTASPILGSAGAKSASGKGNPEWLALVERIAGGEKDANEAARRA